MFYFWKKVVDVIECFLICSGALVRFKEGSIKLNIGLTIDLSPIFTILNFTRGNDYANYDWLETTYVTEGVRIGR